MNTLTNATAGEPPRDGKTYLAVMTVPVRWKRYSEASQQVRKWGLKGRWQKMTEYGGWENVGTPGEFPFEAYFEGHGI